MASNAAALDTYLLEMQEVFGDMSFVANQAGAAIISSYHGPAAHLLDPETNAFLPADELRKRFEAVGAMDKQVINYCGGGIAASADALALIMLGHKDVKLYDASLSEWAKDPTLPMETG